MRISVTKILLSVGVFVGSIPFWVHTQEKNPNLTQTLFVSKIGLDHFVPIPETHPHFALPSKGKTWTYALERSASVYSGGKTVFEIRYAGQLRVEGIAPKRVGSERIRFSGEITAPEAVKKTLSNSKAYLEAEWTGKDPRPTEVALYGGNEYTESDRDWTAILIDLFSQYSYFLPENRVGKTQARFSETVDGGSRILLKQIFAYENRPELTALRSEMQIRLDSSSKPLHIANRESFRIESLPGQGFDQTASSNFTLIPDSDSKTPILPFIRAVTSLSEDSPNDIALSKEASPKRFHVAFDKIGGLPRFERLKALTQFVKDADGGRNELISDLKLWLKNSLHSSIEFNWAIGALASTENPEAQKILVEIYSSPNTTAERKRILLSALTASEIPLAPETQDLVSSQLQNRTDEMLREMALFTLGAAIQKEKDEARKTTLENGLLAELPNAVNPAEKLVLLDAIGNSGSERFIPYVSEQLESTDARIRAKAVQSLRFMDPKVSGPLLAPLASDPSEKVRRMVASVKDSP